MGLTDALAAMLTNESDLVLLRRNPALLRERFGLTEAELSMLAGARSVGYRITRGNVRAKLRHAIGTCLPVTVAHLDDHHRDLWDQFTSTLVRLPQPVDRHGIWESERLAEWLAVRAPGARGGQGLGPLADYARYELERTKLRRSAADIGRGGWTIRTLADDLPLILSVHARVLVFDHDVTAGPPILGLPARRTHLVLHGRPRTARVRTYRINAATARLLARCDGTSTTEHLAADAGNGDPAAVRDALERLLATELVHPA